MSIVDNHGLSRIIDNILNLFSRKNHTHDDRYYTETEIDTKLKGKAASSYFYIILRKEKDNGKKSLFEG